MYACVCVRQIRVNCFDINTLKRSNNTNATYTNINDDSLEQSLSEAAILAKLRHPNTVNAIIIMMIIVIVFIIIINV